MQYRSNLPKGLKEGHKGEPKGEPKGEITGRAQEGPKEVLKGAGDKDNRRAVKADRESIVGKSIHKLERRINKVVKIPANGLTI